ncbi:helix-hairpin-helix domain-containing protein [Allomuricauda sp. SCSIO 65647]|uniref:ComEA family DNA-binding protein n=1 Tax=Allomuricauda sp. SCSIO 65647 TaxID=2908843 RepID=UPI001F30BAB1|nr:helix-hairpin-helix domain-containing protein [Muricauda sp. SCSIO 65647]UJH68064.1 helix-hairpin-helix domain-containing protein [Muricauda sp. SCSIO 65647]
MKKFRSHFRFSRQERSGIFFLLLLIIVLQTIYLFLENRYLQKRYPDFAIDTLAQKRIDNIKSVLLTKDSIRIQRFNPNFISDHRGYVLGMSVDEIDRLHNYRAQDKWINSVEGFQKVTQVSDSLLAAISPYFKFPEWASRQRSQNSGTRQGLISAPIADLNAATAEDLKTIYGIGDKLSARIIKFRNRLGGFLVNGQLNDVYGLEKDVAKRVFEHFQVLNPPPIKKININTATKDEMVGLVYIGYDLADEIITYRQKNGRIDSFDDLAAIQGFPSEKIDRIKLYLSL